jgi:hypothetical protein
MPLEDEPSASRPPADAADLDASHTPIVHHSMAGRSDSSDLLPSWKVRSTLSYMETDSSSGAADAATALQHVRHGRAAAARRITTPGWYHPLAGATLAATLGSGSLTGLARVGVLLGSLIALLGLLQLYRRLTGLWVNLLHVPEMRRATVLATVIALAVFAAGTWLEDGQGVRGALAGAGVLLGIAYVLYWRWVERQLVRILQGAP